MTQKQRADRKSEAGRVPTARVASKPTRLCRPPASSGLAATDEHRAATAVEVSLLEITDCLAYLRHLRTHFLNALLLTRFGIPHPSFEDSL
jgi:hypothetical protein